MRIFKKLNPEFFESSKTWLREFFLKMNSKFYEFLETSCIGILKNESGIFVNLWKLGYEKFKKMNPKIFKSSETWVREF